MTKQLFDMFDAVSTKQWKQKIQVDLKGADYNDTLIHKSHEGINIKPFYNNDDIADTTSQIAMPSQWNIGQHIVVDTVENANKLALRAIKEGAESLFFLIPFDDTNLEELFNGISIDTKLYIETQFVSKDFAKNLYQWTLKNYDIYLLHDIIGNLAQEGNWYEDSNVDHKILDTVTQYTNFKSIISVDLSLYQNAGASIVQQLAYSLAHANEYLNHFDNQKNSIIKNLPIVFKVAVGGNYFFEIAKLRATRLLWASLSAEYKLPEHCHIIAFPSHRNKTVLDYNVNMLRTTTECMSAILGGADSVYNLPYDTIYSTPNDFGNRIAINQLLVLKNESSFEMVDNAADGAYYIENLTSQFAEKAMDLFKSIEQGGGFLHQLKEGIIQRKLKENAQKEQDLFNNEQITLTGTNKYRNTEEQIPKFQKAPFTEKRERLTTLSPIVKRRLSEELEKKLTKNL